MTSEFLYVLGRRGIKIEYNIPDGIQGSSHPHPGARYQGLSVDAYLWDDGEGRKVLKLLERAFKAQLTFTIGPDNKVAWEIYSTNPEHRHGKKNSGRISCHGEQS